uniref:Uncharacterized protein n=1 Tax=mine drainage metagenome TaxID=410659 RepID=E6QFY6_9ZZZZ
MRAGPGIPGVSGPEFSRRQRMPVKVRQGLEALTAPVVIWTDDKRKSCGGNTCVCF